MHRITNQDLTVLAEHLTRALTRYGWLTSGDVVKVVKMGQSLHVVRWNETEGTSVKDVPGFEGSTSSVFTTKREAWLALTVATDVVERLTALQPDSQ